MSVARDPICETIFKAMAAELQPDRLEQQYFLHMKTEEFSQLIMHSTCPRSTNGFAKILLKAHAKAKIL